MDQHITAGTMAQSGNSHSRYPATSSAFSASAHAHEDWTKISDLAERRRIQNRIAQRNYRKKLKKRLEDLEAKAASTSPSPEQQPIQLLKHSPPSQKRAHISPSSTSSTSPQRHSVDVSQRNSQHSFSGLLPLPDSAMFTEQYSRHFSNSPPPGLAYSATTTDPFDFNTFTTSMQQPTTTASYDEMDYSYNPYATTYDTTPANAYTTKTNFYPDIDVNTFNFQYTSTPVTTMHRSSYSESIPQTPPLSDCHDLYIAGSPPDSSFLPQTPPMTYGTSPTLTMV